MSKTDIEWLKNGVEWLVAPDGFKVGIDFQQYRDFSKIGHISIITKIKKDDFATVALFNTPFYRRLDIWDLNSEYMAGMILDSEPGWELDGKDTVVS